jgi:hypothetical protein
MRSGKIHPVSERFAEAYGISHGFMVRYANNGTYGTMIMEPYHVQGQLEYLEMLAKTVLIVQIYDSVVHSSTKSHDSLFHSFVFAS